MRVFCICLGLLLAIAVFAHASPTEDEGPSDGNSVTEETKPPEKPDEDNGENKNTDQQDNEESNTKGPEEPENEVETEAPTEPPTEAPTDATTTEAPTTPAANEKVFSCKHTCYRYLEDGDGEYDKETGKSLTECPNYPGLVIPTSMQINNICGKFQKSPKKHGFVYVRENDQHPWTCCVDPKVICQSDEDGHEALHDTNTHKITPCKLNKICGAGRVCLGDSSSVNKLERDKYMELLSLTSTNEISDICCRPKSTNTECQMGKTLKALEHSQTDCQKGRCSQGKEYGTCIQPKVIADRTASCCQLDDNDLCPGGLIPVSMSIEEKTDDHPAAYDIRIDINSDFNSKKMMRDRCMSLNVTYLNGKDAEERCCPMGVQAKNKYVHTVLKEYNKTSQKPCEDDNGCDKDEYCAGVIDALDQNLVGKKNMCFKRLQCPNVKDKVFSNPNINNTDLNCNPLLPQCKEGDVCVPYSNNLGICCPTSAYEASCAASEAGHPDIQELGKIEQIPIEKCVNDDEFRRASVPVSNKDAKEKPIKVCCQWKAPKNETGKCLNGGNYMKNDKLALIQCAKDAPDGSKCADKGVCRKVDESKSLCCDENRCPTDSYTPMNGLAACTDKDCVWADKGTSLQQQYCHEDKGGTSRCCPPVMNKKTVKEIEDSKIKSYALKGTSCKQPADCGGWGKYCKDNVCWAFGANAEYSKTKCKTNEECTKEIGGKRKFYCLVMEKPGDPGICVTHVKVVEAKAKEINKGLVAGTAVCAVCAVLFGLAATVSFLKYRSKNFCDSRKPSKKDKKSKKADKTEGTTGGGETTGGTTSKVDTVK